jgi:hypothetical protein
MKATLILVSVLSGAVFVLAALAEWAIVSHLATMQ